MPTFKTLNGFVKGFKKIADDNCFTSELKGLDVLTESERAMLVAGIITDIYNTIGELEDILKERNTK